VNRQSTQVDDLQLVALPNAVNVAQMFVRFAVSEWSLRPMADDAAEVVAGLVGTAVREAGQEIPEMITVRIELDGESLVIEVEDQHLAVQGTKPGAPSGLRCGVAPRRGGGRVLWCELPLPGGMTADSVPLPKRERRPSPEAKRLADEGEPMGVDPQVIERIMTALSRSTDRRD
jgi:hypothetical protein